MAFNLLYDRSPDFQGAVAVTARRPGARTYLLRSWQGRVLAGTYHAPMLEGAPDQGPSEALIDEFGRERDEAMSALRLSSSRVLRVLWGQLPVKRPGTVELSSRDVIWDHGVGGGPRGLFSVSGVKFTTARRTAARALALMGRKGHLDRLPVPADSPPTPRTPLSGVDIGRMAREAPEEERRVITSIVSEEAVVHAEDLLLRRTDWGVAGDPGHPLRGLIQELVSPRAGQASP